MSRKIKSFVDIVGHKHLLSYLNKAIERDSIPNVIILNGNPGMGKSSIAKLLAIEAVTRLHREKKQEYIKAVIEDNRSTDSIKLFNMSVIQEKEEEIQKVVAELSTTFSSTQRKVLILDEAHNMSKRAQDAILIELEHLDEGVYVFICTTEIGSLRPALVSRAIATFQVRDLSEGEARSLLRSEIVNRSLNFLMGREVAIAIITSWASNQPRKMLNLLDNFEIGQSVSVGDMETFMSMTTSPAVVELVRYLYGSLVLGIQYLEGMRFDDTFVMMLIEVCKVALGGDSVVVSQKDKSYINSFMLDNPVSNLVMFTAEVAGLSELKKRCIISSFMRAHIEFKSLRADELDGDTRAKDLKELRENVSIADSGIDIGIQDEVKALSIEELFANSQGVM